VNVNKNIWDGPTARTNLWSRSFSGLHMNNTALNAWNVNVNGNLNSNNNLTNSQAVAPAFNRCSYVQGCTDRLKGTGYSIPPGEIHRKDKKRKQAGMRKEEADSGASILICCPCNNFLWVI